MVGGIASDEKSRGIQLADLSKVDPQTAIITMIGDREFQAERPRVSPHPAAGERSAGEQEAFHARGVGRPRLPEPLGDARQSRFANGRL
jgi:hypothetical protein